MISRRIKIIGFPPKPILTAPAGEAPPVFAFYSIRGAAQVEKLILEFEAADKAALGIAC